MTSLQISDLVYPVTSLGYGTRLGIWVQGCTIGCPGCMSQDTWDSDGGRPVAVADVMDVLTRTDLPIDGVTISGGEPFQQPQALMQLMAGIHEWRGRAPKPVDLLCFSGYTERHLRRSFPELIRMFDLIVAGPYRSQVPSNRPLCGSDNQVVMEMTPLGSACYALIDGSRRMQVSVDGGVLHVIGIPSSGDLMKLEASLSDDFGVGLKGVSWRS
jgi:anaerobic ribonucleoside-triphosphate reductase activating protein